jgi:endonuclease YncB( thermonuclease family)
MGIVRLFMRMFVRETVSVVISDPRPVRAAPLPPEPQRRLTVRGYCYVLDGDTLVIDKCTIRLAGIDAPELDHPWGQKAKWALVSLCRNQVVTAEITGELSHGRAVAVCRLEDGRDLAAELVRMGLALDWRKHSGGRYSSLEPAGSRRRHWRADARQKGKFIVDAQR